MFQLENFKRVFLNFASVHINLLFHGSLQFYFCYRTKFRLANSGGNFPSVSSSPKSALILHTVSNVKLSKDIEQVQKRCLKLLYPFFSYSEALNKSGLDRFGLPSWFDHKKTYSEKLKILSTHSITYCPLLKCPMVKWFSGLHTRINFHRYGCDFVPHCFSKKFVIFVFVTV